MSLRKKTFFTIGITLVGLLAVLYASTSTILLRGFADLEEQNTVENVDRVLEAIFERLGTLSSKAGDWANWDDTYDFIEDANQEFINTNPTDKSLIELRINLLVFVHASGRMVFAKAFDLDKGVQTPIPYSLQEHLGVDSPLLHHPDLESSTMGLIVLPEGPMLLASRPILSSEGKGPIRGTLVMGRFLDGTEQKNLAGKTRVGLSVYLFDDARTDPVLKSICDSLMGEGKPALVRAPDTDTVVGYALLKDIYGNPALLLQVVVPRAIYRQGQATMRYLILSLVVIGLVFAGATLLLLERMVLSRLSRLSSDVNGIGRKADLGVRVTTDGNDELGSVAASINGMLDALESSQDGLRKAHTHLEARVQERTAELARANGALQAEITERKRAEQALKGAHDQLEANVEERTAELVSANEQLKLEIEERRKAEEALRESERRYREMADMLPQIVFETNEGGRITFANRAALEAFGFSRNDFEEGICALDCIAPEDREKVRENIGLRLQGLVSEGLEYNGLKKDGNRFPMLVYSTPILRGGCIVTGLRGIVVDLTERKKIEAELLRSQKLESLGVLAGGIAHDFNNFLTVVIGNISIAKTHAPPGGRFQHKLAEAEEACLRAKDLTQQLLTFSRGGAPVKKALSLAGLVKESASFALRGSNVRCRFFIPEDLWPVEADEVQIGQVINNLVINADQAMPSGGIIEVSARNLPPESLRGLPLQPARYVEVSIKDRGTGIPPGQLSRIFDPYFTTKPKGSGLGLAAVHSIIARHEGHVTVTSQLGHGTTFLFYIPASDREVAQAEPADAVCRGGNGRILIMDDDRLVRDISGEMLSSMGYEVTFAEDSTEAVALYKEARESGKEFDAVIMDLTVPGGMGGKEAIHGVIDIDPNARVIVSSGYSNDPVMSRFREYGFKGVVAKPYRIEELSRTVREVILAG